MAAFMLSDVDILASGLDLSPFASQVECSVSVQEVESTTYASGGWRTMVPGIRSTTLTASGPTDMATASAAQLSAVDEVLGVGLGTEYVVSVVPLGATVGAVAWTTTGQLMSRTPLQGAVGDLATHQLMFGGTNPLVRGTVMAASTITATGTGTITQLGAVSATQRVYAAVHTLTAGGTTPTITVKVQSAAAVGFATPTDRLTFSAINSKTGAALSATGAITDQYWRATWTVSGSSPSFQAVIVVGIA